MNDPGLKIGGNRILSWASVNNGSLSGLWSTILSYFFLKGTIMKKVYTFVSLVT